MKSLCEKREKENVRAVRTLYDYFHARVNDSRNFYDRGHILSGVCGDGSLDITRLARSVPLVLATCQDYIDFDNMGTHLPEDEKGWLKEGLVR